MGKEASGLIFRNNFCSSLLILLLILWPGTLVAQSLIHLTFGNDEIGTFPSGWGSRDKTNMGKVYSVQSEDGAKFLHADARGSSVQIGYERGWALKEFPIIRWRWRAVLFPEGSNERERGGNDSALGLYVVFSYFPVRAIKYIWSDTLPEGSSFSSPYSSGAKMVVVRSGRAGAGAWVSQERNVLDDYRRLFGDLDKNPAAKGIAVLTDADNTKSHAIGDYTDIEVLGTHEKESPLAMSLHK